MRHSLLWLSRVIAGALVLRKSTLWIIPYAIVMAQQRERVHAACPDPARMSPRGGGRECHEAFRKGHGGVGRGRMHILFGGVATANAADVTNKDNPITSSNVRVSDVGAQTANVSFDYKIDPAQVDEIKDVCFSIEVQRITDITPIEKAHSSANTIGGTGFPYAARAFPMMS